MSPEQAPDTPTYVELSYEKGDIVAIDGKAVTAGQVMEQFPETRHSANARNKLHEWGIA